MAEVGAPIPEIVSVSANLRKEERWEKLFSDYRMNLICVNEIEDFSKYHTSLKLLLMLLANRKSIRKMKEMMKENQEFKKVDKETARVAGKLLGVTPDMEKVFEQEGEEIDMCTGLKEWLMEERSEGRAEGRDILNSLNNKLVQDGRIEDLIKALDDLPYQNQLLQEYGLG